MYNVLPRERKPSLCVSAANIDAYNTGILGDGQEHVGLLNPSEF